MAEIALDLSDPLVPPKEMLFDGTRNVRDFMDIANGYLRAYLIPHGRLAPDNAILDIGSGNGKLAWALTKYLNTNGKYFGFDINKIGIDCCKHAYRDRANFIFEFADLYSDFYNPTSEGRAENYVFPYIDNVFDVAFAGSLFTHVEPNITNNYLTETFRVLKPGGRLVMTCALVNEHNLGRPSETAVRQRHYTRVSPFHHVLDVEKPSHAIAYDESALRRMIANSGMIVSSILFGTWANGSAVVPGFQDVIICIKPQESGRITHHA